MTILGKVALKLPVDVAVARLILVGCSIGLMYEAVILAADLSYDQDSFTVPNRFTAKTPFLYAKSVDVSLEERFKRDGGYFSDALQICTMFDCWMKVRHSTSGSLNRLRKQFGTEYGVHPFKHSQLELMVTAIARKLSLIISEDDKPVLESLCSLHHVKDTIQMPSTASLTITMNKEQIKALIALSFSDNLILGTPETTSLYARTRHTAMTELDKMKKYNFDPNQTVVMRHFAQGSEKTLEELADLKFPRLKVNVKLSNDTAFVNIPTIRGEETQTWATFYAKTSVRTVKPSKEVLYLWQYADRNRFWMPKGLAKQFPLIRQPMQFSWQLANGFCESVRNLSFRNPAGFVLGLEDESQLVAVGGSLTSRSDDFMTARSGTVLSKHVQ